MNQGMFVCAVMRAGARTQSQQQPDKYLPVPTCPRVYPHGNNKQALFHPDYNRRL